MYVAAGQGRQPQGTKFWCQQKPLVTSVICYNFQKNLFEVWFYIKNHDFIHVYSPGPGTDNPLGTKFWCQQEHLVTSVICCKFQKNLFEVWFYTFFFMILYMYIDPGQGLTAPRGQSFDFNRNVLSLHSFVASLKKKVFEVWLYKIKIHDLIHVYSLGAGADSPPGDKILMSTERPYHFTHLLQVSKKSLWSLILYNFFHDLIYVYSPRAGADSPLGTKFWCQQKGLITIPICCKFQRNLFAKKSLWKLILYIFFMI